MWKNRIGNLLQYLYFAFIHVLLVIFIPSKIMLIFATRCFYRQKMDCIRYNICYSFSYTGRAEVYYSFPIILCNIVHTFTKLHSICKNHFYIYPIGNANKNIRRGKENNQAFKSKRYTNILKTRTKVTWQDEWHDKSSRKQ